MAINNELSGEIAVALLTSRSKTAEERDKLKKVILTVHDTLRGLTAESRKSIDGKEVTAREASDE